MANAVTTPRAGSFALAACCLGAALSWISLTMVPLLDTGLVLLMAGGCAAVSAVIAGRVHGAQRRLASIGAVVAVLPLLVVAAFLAASGG